MAVLDLIKDPRVKKLKRLDARWRVVGNELSVDGEKVGEVDFNRSRFWEGRYYASVSSGEMFVLDALRQEK